MKILVSLLQKSNVIRSQRIATLQNSDKPNVFARVEGGNPLPPRFSRKALAIAVLLCGLSAGWLVGADVTVEKTGTGKLGIDLSGLNAAGGNAALFRKVLEGDLNNSGWFTIAEKGRAGILVAGECADSGGDISITYEVKNQAGTKKYLGKTDHEAGANARKLAHKVADDIVFAVKGVKGIASTRIAMVGKIGGRKDVFLCDADGGNVTQITRDRTIICLALTWSPNGDSLLYTSDASRYSDVYMINLNDFKRRRIMKYPGLNIGADVSPDGNRIAVVLSKDGNPGLYVTDINGENPMRLTRMPRAAEANPSWAPDGNQIVFVSNKSGLPQLYTTTASAGGYTRITFRGSENVAPDWGANGKIAYVSKRDGKYHICVYDPAKNEDKQLTSEAADDEDPSWAPDGIHIVFSRTVAYHSDLYVLDTMGGAPLRLTTIQGEWTSPAWSPR
jgi:TolB protein